MASLTGNLVAETYKALLKTIDNDILTASEKQITDGLGGGSNVFIDSNGFLRANKYKVTNGLATQFLKADGSLDANTYLTSITGAQVITALGYTPVTNQRTLTINGVTYNLTADRSWTVAGTAAIWGNITGTLSHQTDLQNALNAKYDDPTGTISQYIRGDGSIANFPALTGYVPYTGATANVDLGEYALSAEYLAIDTDTTHVTDVGEIVWNPIDGTFDMGLLNGVVLQAGQELHFYGKAVGAIGNGQAVMFAGVQGDHILMSLADAATINANPQYFIGIATQDFVNNEFGYVTVLGKVRGLNTTSYSLGDVLYYNSTSATDGLLTTTMPVAPNAKIEVAAVVRVHATQGILMVRPHIMPKLNQVQDVYIADPANNHGIFYDLAAGYWRNTSIATALGYTPQAQLSGTGFVKASGTTISYDNSTYLTTADAASTYQRLDKMVSNLLASDTEYPNSNAVIAALALKANAANPVFTGNMTISGAEPKLFFTDTDNNPDYTVFIDSGIFYIYDQTAGATRFSIGSTGNISAGVGKSITADSFIKDGGTASQFLKADGSIDSSTYVSSSVLADYLLSATAASTYQRLDKMVSNLLASDTEYPNSNAVIAALALKANAANPVFTGDFTISGATPRLYFVDTDQNPDYTVFIDSGFFYIYDQTAGATRFSINSSGNISAGVGKSITAGSFVRDGGTASQFLMADGSVSTGPNISAYLPLAGGTMTGVITTPNSTFGIIIGDDSRIADRNIANTLFLEGVQNNDRGYINFSETTGNALGAINGGALTWRGVAITTTANISGTTNYIPKFTSANVIGNSAITDDGTTVSLISRGLSGSSATFTGNVQSARFYNTILNATNNSRNSFQSFNLNEVTITLGWIAADFGDLGTTSDRVVIGSGYTNKAIIGGHNGILSAWASLYVNPGGGNLIVGASTDAGYKFDVNGSGRFSGNLRAISAIINDGANTTDGIKVISVTTASVMTGGIEFMRTTVAGGSKIQPLRDAAIGGVGLNFLVTTNNTAEVNATYTSALQILNSGLATFSGGITANGDILTGLTSSSYQTANRTAVVANGTSQSLFGLVVGGVNKGYFFSEGTNILLMSESASGYMSFGTANSEKVRITSNGNVGIGNTNPSARLSVYKSQAGASSAESGVLRLENTGLNYTSTIVVTDGTTNDALISYLGPTQALGFGIGATATQMILRPNGNLLIGTQTDFGNKLFVNGEIAWSTGTFNAILGSVSSSWSGSTIFPTLYGSTADRWVMHINPHISYTQTGVNGYSGSMNGATIRMAGNPAAVMFWDIGVGVCSVGNDVFAIGRNNSALLSLNNTGNLTATAFFESSDIRLKTLIENNPIIDGIENLEAKLYEKAGKIEIGYFAQDAELIMPYAVTKNADGFLNLSYREVHTAKIARLEKEVKELKAQLNLN